MPHQTAQQKKYTYFYKIGIVSLAMLLVACDNEPKNQQKSENKQTTSTTQRIPSTLPNELPHNQSTVASVVATNPLAFNQAQYAKQKDEQAQAFATMVTASMARVASSKNDVCPKLLDFQFVSQSISRQNEKMPQSQCEYFVFLDAGDRLKVKVTDDVKAELVSPVWFDFNNGVFTANTFDRYTLRVKYNGTRYNPQNFVYDVVVSKNPTKDD